MSWENKVFFIILMAVAWAWLFFMGMLMKKHDFGWGETTYNKYKDSYFFFGTVLKKTPENKKKIQKTAGNFFMIFSSCMFVIGLIILFSK